MLEQGGGLLYEKVGDCHLLSGIQYKSRILITLRVLTTKHHFFSCQVSFRAHPTNIHKRNALVSISGLDFCQFLEYNLLA